MLGLLLAAGCRSEPQHLPTEVDVGIACGTSCYRNYERFHDKASFDACEERCGAAMCVSWGCRYDAGID
jgi:hypothetical protein